MTSGRSRKRSKKRPRQTSGSKPDDAQIDAALGSQHLEPDERHDFIAALMVKHPSVLRLRRELDPETLGFETPRLGLEPIPWFPTGFRNTDLSVRPSTRLSYGCADFFLQDAGSLLALAACDIDQFKTKPMLVCDLCAAPGGKASALLEEIGDGFLLANEPIKSRIAPLAYNLARTGVPRYAISCLDPDELAKRVGGVFDLVLVDAPCSGQALLGRGRQSISALSAKQIEHSAARQRRILDAALELLRPGGRLVYSTCTFAEAENETQVARLVETHRVAPLPVESLTQYASGFPGCYRLWPHRHRCAGSFAAAMTGDRETQPAPVGRRNERDSTPTCDLEEWFAEIGNLELQVSGSVVWGYPADVPPWVFGVAIAGPELVHQTGQTWKPSHAAGLRRGTHAISREAFACSAADACHFLSGGPLECEHSGWQVVTHQSRPLGWIKGSLNRATGRMLGKNQLPGAARCQVKPPLAR